VVSQYEKQNTIHYTVRVSKPTRQNDDRKCITSLLVRLSTKRFIYKAMFSKASTILWSLKIKLKKKKD